MPAVNPAISGSRTRQIHNCVRGALIGLQTNTSKSGTRHRAARYKGMESAVFKNLSPLEICRRMSAICQQSADETPPGIEQDRFQRVSDKFRDEADDLAMQDLQLALLWSPRLYLAHAPK